MLRLRRQPKVRSASPVALPETDQVQEDYGWVRLVLPLMLYAGVGLLGCFVFWTTGLARSGGAPQIALAEPAGLEARINRQGAPLDLARWYPNDDRGQGRLDHKAGGGVTIASQSVAKPFAIGGQALDLPSHQSGLLAETSHSGGARFFGHRIGSEVRSVVFLIDASGSMADTLPFVVRELTSSLAKLEEGTSFSVIFFAGDGRVLEVPPVGLKPATKQNTHAAAEWIDPESGNVFAGGQTSPLEALALALSYEPQAIQLLSDNITGRGRWEVVQADLLEKISKINTSGARIDTVQFLYPDPLRRQSGMGTLELLSLRSGGSHRFVDGRELGISR